MIIRGKRRKSSKNKMQIPRGGVPRPPSQFESSPLSSSYKSNAFQRSISSMYATTHAYKERKLWISLRAGLPSENVRVRHVDILLLTCIAYRRMMSLKWIIRFKGWKEVKKEVKRLKKNKSISISRKRSLCRRLLSNRKYYRIQNITNNKKKVAWKRKPLEKKIRKKEDNNVDNKENKKKKQQKQNVHSAGRSSSAPKPVWE